MMVSKMMEGRDEARRCKLLLVLDGNVLAGHLLAVEPKQ